MLVFKPHNTSRISSYLVELVKVYLCFPGSFEKTRYISIYVNSKVLCYFSSFILFSPWALLSQVI